jgi:hypothetical protein
MAGDPVGSVDLESVRARAYEKALDQARDTPEGYLRAADALRMAKIGVRELHAAVAAGRVRTTAVDGGLRAYLREDVEALAGRSSDAE